MKKPDKEAVSVARHIGTFLRSYAPVYMTGSPNTLKSYRTSLSLYLGFLEEKSIMVSSLRWDLFGREWIEQWIKWLKESRQCGNASCNVRLGSLRAFLKYVGEHEPGLLHLYQEAATIKTHTLPARKIEGLTKEAVKTILKMPDLQTSTGRRDLAFMILLYATATRISEILSLKIKDVHLNDRKPCVTITGKGNKVRTLYLLPSATAHLEHYIQEFHGNAHDREAYLFFSRCGGLHTMLTPPAIDKRLKKYAAQAHEICKDVPLTLHPHQFRHAKASHWLEEGINIVQISLLLGHAQLQTTMVYLDISEEKEREALATLETENDKKVSPKWKLPDGSLKDFCGLN